MKKIIMLCLIFGASLVGAEKAQQYQQVLFKNVNKNLQHLVNIALYTDAIHAGAALFHFSESLQDEKYVIKARSVAILSKYDVLDGEKVNNDVRGAFKKYGQSELRLFGAFFGYETLSKEFQQSDD